MLMFIVGKKMTSDLATSTIRVIIGRDRVANVIKEFNSKRVTFPEFQVYCHEKKGLLSTEFMLTGPKDAVSQLTDDVMDKAAGWTIFEVAKVSLLTTEP